MFCTLFPNCSKRNEMSQLPCRVLFADDDPTMTLLMRAALATPDFVLTVVDNGREALAEYQRKVFDIVLLDVEMPELDGFEVCAEIRRSVRGNTPVVLVTSHNDPAFLRRVAELSASHLAKPIDWLALRGLLKALS